MPRLKLTSLYCETTEDNAGPDEAYLVVNGKRVWGPESINDREPRPVDIEIDFSTSAKVRLYDQDTGVWDKDDYLGEITVSANQAGQGEQQDTFTEDDANYTLYYEVV